MRHAVIIEPNRMGDLVVYLQSKALADRLMPRAYDDGESLKGGAYIQQGFGLLEFMGNIPARKRRQIDKGYDVTVWLYDELVFCLFNVAY